MNEPFLCTVDPAYMFYLSRADSRVSKKSDLDRPFVANVITLNGFQYAIPFTSQVVPDSGKPRSPFFTSFVSDSHGSTISALLYNNMIPVMERNIAKINVDAAPQNSRLTNQARYIRANEESIAKKAATVYRAKERGNNYLGNIICCNFKELETLCISFNQEQRDALSKNPRQV